jgi:hypothetical protein
MLRRRAGPPPGWGGASLRASYPQPPTSRSSGRPPVGGRPIPPRGGTPRRQPPDGPRRHARTNGARRAAETPVAASQPVGCRPRSRHILDAAGVPAPSTSVTSNVQALWSRSARTRQAAMTPRTPSSRSTEESSRSTGSFGGQLSSGGPDLEARKVMTVGTQTPTAAGHGHHRPSPDGRPASIGGRAAGEVRCVTMGHQLQTLGVQLPEGPGPPAADRGRHATGLRRRRRSSNSRSLILVPIVRPDVHSGREVAILTERTTTRRVEALTQRTRRS